LRLQQLLEDIRVSPGVPLEADDRPSRAPQPGARRERQSDVPRRRAGRRWVPRRSLRQGARARRALPMGARYRRGRAERSYEPKSTSPGSSSRSSRSRRSTGLPSSTSSLFFEVSARSRR
jgi:hypothetical protein